MTNRAARRRADRAGAKRVVAPPVGPVTPQSGPGAPQGIPEVRVDIDYLLKRIGALDVEVDVWKTKAFSLEQQLTQVLALQGGDEEPTAEETPTPIVGALLTREDLEAVQREVVAEVPEAPPTVEQEQEIAEKAAWVDEGGLDEVPESPVTIPPEEAQPPTEEPTEEPVLKNQLLETTPIPGGIEA